MLRNPNLYNQPQYNSERQGRKFGVGSFFKLLLLFIIIIGIGYFLFFSKIFDVREVIVKSQNNSDTENIKKITKQHLQGNKNIFLFNISDTKKEIEAQTENIRSVSIYRGLPSTVQVVIAEREPALVWNSGGKYYLVDKQGYAYRQVDNKMDYPEILDEKSIEIQIGQKILPTDFIDFVSQLKDKIKQKNNLAIASISVPVSVIEIHVKVDKGYVIYLSTDRPLDQQLENLNQALAIIGDSPISYIDLRVPGRAFYQ